MDRPEGTPTVLIDNDSMRVTEWRFVADAHTGWHRHEYDYVIVPLTTGTLHIVAPDGESDSQLAVGVPYFRPAGVEHDVINASGGDFRFLEVERKT